MPKSTVCIRDNPSIYRDARISHTLRLYWSAVGAVSFIVTAVPKGTWLFCILTQNVSPVVAKYWLMMVWPVTGTGTTALSQSFPVPLAVFVRLTSAQVKVEPVREDRAIHLCVSSTRRTICSYECQQQLIS